jgi:glycosyltransferase involved in cell wall biosynthesis
MDRNKIKVLMATGVYYPEINGAVLQCMKLISLMKDDVDFEVFTSTKNKEFSNLDRVEGVRVNRVFVGNLVILSHMQFCFNAVLFFIKNDLDIVHMHGFSRRHAFLILLSKIFRKKTILKMTSIGHDDPISVRQSSKYLFFFYSLVDSYIGLSPAFTKLFKKSSLNNKRYYQIPNGVNTNVFYPLKRGECKRDIRIDLNLPINIDLILVVGHLSIDKAPGDVLDAWIKVKDSIKNETGIIFLGSSDLDNFEVHEKMVLDMKEKSKPFLNSYIFFIDHTNCIEKYYQAANLYILPSKREGLPNALLEAMSCGLTIISTELPGLKDWIVEHKKNGVLYSAGNIEQLGSWIKICLDNKNSKDNLNMRINSVKTIRKNFNINNTAKNLHEVYKELVSGL